tara:strand:+ start:16160 stop:16321 length:162 start_codon:yes stop_codon:yes gene_type:complete
MLDPVFVKNLDSITRFDAKRIFDEPVAIEASIPPSELQPEDSLSCARYLYFLA